MDIQLLREPQIAPTKEVLKKGLSSAYPIYEILIETISTPQYGLTHEWRYYNDGKAWLCKVTDKKKTIFWLSAWSGYFQIGVYFTEKHFEGIDSLNIDKKIKEDFFKLKTAGKLRPIVFKISQKKQLPDLLTVITFKKRVK